MMLEPLLTELLNRHSNPELLKPSHRDHFVIPVIVNRPFGIRSREPIHPLSRGNLMLELPSHHTGEHLSDPGCMNAVLIISGRQASRHSDNATVHSRIGTGSPD